MPSSSVCLTSWAPGQLQGLVRLSTLVTLGVLQARTRDAGHHAAGLLLKASPALSIHDCPDGTA